MSPKRRAYKPQPHLTETFKSSIDTQQIQKVLGTVELFSRSAGFRTIGSGVTVGRRKTITVPERVAQPLRDEPYRLLIFRAAFL